MVSQGVTTAIGGPDGSAPWPLAPYLKLLEKQGVGLNVCLLVGHNSVRRAVMALENRAPTQKELARMRTMVGQAMDEGAWGISTGLKYLPGSFSKTYEVIALSREAAARGGYYTSHLREEGLGLLDVETRMAPDKTLTRVTADHAATGTQIDGYEIHIGQTVGADCATPFAHINGTPDGAGSRDGKITGTYLHGLFTNDSFRSAWLAQLGLGAGPTSYSQTVEDTLDALADHAAGLYRRSVARERFTVTASGTVPGSLPVTASAPGPAPGGR